MTELSPATEKLIAETLAWQKTNGDEIDVYTEGLIYASVCTSLPDNELDARMAKRPISGLRTGWTRSADETFAGGLPNPCTCEAKPATHRHVLFEC